MNRASSKHSVLYSVRAKMHVRASAMLVRGTRRSLIITSRGIGREFSTPAGPLAKFLAATEPLVPRFLTDDKIDAAFADEKRRLNGFHSVASLMDRPTTLPRELTLDLEPWARGSEMLGADDCAQLLGEVREAAAAQREHLQQRVDVYAWHVAYGDGAAWASALEEEGGGGGGVDGGASEERSSVVDEATANGTASTGTASTGIDSSGGDSSSPSLGDGIASDLVSYVVNPEVESEAALRLRLLEHTCASLTRLFPSANPPSGVGSRTRDDAVGKWKAAVTASRVDHGVWVSVPALLHRARDVLGSIVPALAPDALPLPPPTAISSSTSKTSTSTSASSSIEDKAPLSNEPNSSDENSADITSVSSSSSSDPQLPRAVVLVVLRACLEGGYEKRLEALASLFDHSCEPPEDDALNCALAEVLAKAKADAAAAMAEADGGAAAAAVDVDESALSGVPPALSWPEMEVVLRVGAEAAALALRDELLAFTAVNPVDPVHQVLQRHLQQHLGHHAQIEHSNDGDAASPSSSSSSSLSAASDSVVADAVTKAMRLQAIGTLDPAMGTAGMASVRATHEATAAGTPSSSSSTEATRGRAAGGSSTTSAAGSAMSDDYSSFARPRTTLEAIGPSAGTTNSHAKSKSVDDDDDETTAEEKEAEAKRLAAKAEREAKEALAWAVAGRTGSIPPTKDELAWAARHARVWLLHDLDYTHKWRCCFAWADRPGEAEQQEEKASATSGGSGMDFSTWKGPDLLGTSQLDGYRLSASQLVGAQKVHFVELGGFSQHFTATFKTKKLEKYAESKGNRESARYGVLFTVAVALFDQFIIEK